MLELFGEVNYLAVLLAAVAMFVVSGLWYSKLMFAVGWMRENKFSEKDLGNPTAAMIKSFFAYLVLAFGLAVLLLVVQFWDAEMSWLDGVRWGIFMAVLIHGAAAFPSYAWEKRTLMLFLINIGNSVLGIAIMGAILAWMG